MNLFSSGFWFPGSEHGHSDPDFKKSFRSGTPKPGTEYGRSDPYFKKSFRSVRSKTGSEPLNPERYFYVGGGMRAFFLDSVGKCDFGKAYGHFYGFNLSVRKNRVKCCEIGD